LLLAPPLRALEESLRALEESLDAKALAQKLTQQMVHPWDPDAPLERWRQVRAFDTAQECEDLKTKSHYEALRTVWIMYPSPPDPSGAPPRTLDEIIEEVLKKDRETIEKGLKEAERQEAMMTEEQKQKKGRAWQEWKEKIDKIVVARKPMERAVHEQYRHWKCVPADAVYGPGVKRKP
jgi:hypothetical protein